MPATQAKLILPRRMRILYVAIGCLGSFMVMLCIDMLRFRDAALFRSWAWAFDTNSKSRANLIGHTADPGAAMTTPYQTNGRGDLENWLSSVTRLAELREPGCVPIRH